MCVYIRTIYGKTLIEAQVPELYSESKFLLVKPDLEKPPPVHMLIVVSYCSQRLVVFSFFMSVYVANLLYLV